MTATPTAPLRALVVGGASLDAIVQLEQFPEPRPATIYALGAHETVGGTGAGKALNLARLGFDVTLQLTVGDDAAGRAILDLVEARGVRTIVDRQPGETERHVNLMAREGGRISIYTVFARTPPVIDWPRLEAAVREADVVCLNILDYCRHLIPAIRAAGKPIWCDLHDWDGESEYHRDFVAAADYVFMSSDRLAEPRAAMARLHADGKRLVVCTHGRNGATAVGADGAWLDAPIAEGFTARDTNGAGDAFMSGAMYGLLAGRPLEESLRLGAITAGMCVESPELFSPALSPAALEAELARRWGAGAGA